MIIAIDGPAGAGKSTIARNVARTLDFQLIDTGALYRTVAVRALEQGIDLEDGEKVASLASNLDFSFQMISGENVLYCNGEVVGQEIRTGEVSRAASIVSAHPEVRQALLDVQRELGRREDSVLEGRDIGTVVFPDAEVKIFLTASPEVRAKRRMEQLEESGQEAEYEEILREIRQRDARDTERAAAPLTMAEDATPVDTTNKSIEEVVEEILKIARERGASEESE